MNEYDGKIVIGTVIDKTGFRKGIEDLDKGINSVQSKMDKLTQKALATRDVNGVQMTGVWQLSEKEQAYYDRLARTRDQLIAKKEEELELEEELSRELERQNQSSEEQVNEKNTELSKVAELSAELERMVDDYNLMQNQDIVSDQDIEDAKLLKEEIIKTVKEIEKLTGKKIHIKGITDVKRDVDGIGNGIEKVIKKVGRWGLAIFGIRSAYMFIRQSMSVLSEHNEKLAADIQNIRYALASALQPVIEWIIQLVYKLLQYLAIIIKAFTGRNIFENANKGLKKAVGSAKELKKQLASFDEMNILNKNNGSGGSGGASPSVDLTKLGDEPGWAKFLVKYKEPILAILAGIVATLVAMKLGFKAIKALGIGIAVAGLVYAIEKLLDFLKDPTFENFIGILEGIAIAVAGVAIAIGAWPVAVGAAIALVIIEIVKHFDEIRGLFYKLLDWMDKNVLGTLRKIFGPVGDIIYAPFEFVVTMIKSLFENLFGGIRKIIEGIIDIFKGNFWDGVKKIFGGLGDILMAPFNALLDGVRTVMNRIKDFLQGIYNWIYEKIISPISSKLSSLWNKVKQILGLQSEAEKNANKYNAGGGGYASGGGGGGSYGGGGSVGSRAKGGIFYPSLLPRLAVGGIVNNPGPGVPYNGAIIGERGAEAVVPLTDSQQMQLLGETIGRYITVNAKIPVYVGNRQVAREIRLIQAEDDYAFNR